MVDFDRFDGPRNKPSRGFDIKKTYFGSFPEFEDKSRNAGIDVYPIFESEKPIRRRAITILESAEVKNRHAQVKAELGLTGTGKHLTRVQKSNNVQPKNIDNIAGDEQYYLEQLGTQKINWDEI